MKKQHLIALAISLTALLGPSAARAVDVFGVELGKALSVPECAKSAEFAGIIYGFQQSTVCWATQNHEGVSARNELVTTPRDDSVFILFPTRERPAFVIHETLKALLIAGNVEEIHFDIDPNHFAAAYEAFVQKFGKPRSRSNSPVRNRLGVAFDNLRFQWDISGTVVFLEKRSRDIETGYAVIKSAVAVGKDKEAEDAKKSSERKL